MENQQQQKIVEAREALQRAKAIRRSRKEFGVDGIRHHVKDVDSDWLENWSEPSSRSLN